MKRVVRSVGVGLAGLVLLSCAHQRAPAAHEQVDVESDIQVIKNLLEGNAEFLSSRDVDGWISQFTEDAVFMPENHVAVQGRAAGRAFVQPWYENFDAEFDITVDEVEVHGGWAFARWSFTSRTTPVGGGVTIERSGKEIWIFRRQPDREWKCSHIIYNYDSPLTDPMEEPQ